MENRNDVSAIRFRNIEMELSRRRHWSGIKV